MKTILIGIPLLFLLFALGVGDEGWLFLVALVTAFVVYHTRFVLVRCLAVLTCLGVVFAHGAGYKLYGRAFIVDNLPVLHAPEELAAFVLPNVVVLKDGSRRELRDVKFTPLVSEVGFEFLRATMGAGASNPVLIEADPASPSGFVVQRRCEYWCGNTFFPTFKPERLPMYVRDDLGEFLYHHRLAELTRKD